MTDWMMMLPTEMEPCCRMLGTAITTILPRIGSENSLPFSSPSTVFSRLNTTATASTQLTP